MFDDGMYLRKLTNNHFNLKLPSALAALENGAPA